ncbi:MAG TPA: AraC family transcriptional regulator [Jatrophihabitantaceae bacterium]
MAARFDRAWTSVYQWPGMRSEYSWIPPGGEPTRTAPDQIGVSFSAHNALVYESGRRTIETDLAAGSVIVTGRDPITWLRVRETTEALEIYPDLNLLQKLVPGAAALEPVPPGRDATVLGIASILKRVHATGSTLSDVAASTLAHKLAGHLLDNYCDRRGQDAAPWVPTRLDRRTVDRVAAFVDAELSGVLTLDRLAAVARLSPFHFARAFKATTGLAPHQFVTSRRMHRATTLLVQSTARVDQVAHAVGLSNISHFRRVFRTHLGVTPGRLREDSKFGPSA